MALDPTMSESLLGTWRNMMKEVQEKGLDSGDDYDQMKKCMDRMEDLAANAEGDMMESMNWFNGKVMNENLYGDFSDAYGRVLQGGAGGIGAKETDDYDDGALLKQVLDGLRGSIAAIRKGKQDALDEANNYDAVADMEKGMDMVHRNAGDYGLDTSDKHYKTMTSEAGKQAEKTKQDQLDNPEHYSNAKEIEASFKDDKFIEPIEALIKLGEEEGMTLPRFLRIQIERGMDKAAEGTFANKESLEIDIKWEEATRSSSYELELRQECLALWDSLVPSAPFGVPDTFKFKLARQKIEHKYQPDIKKWEAIKDNWEDVINALDMWIRAHTKYAEGMDPWKMIADRQAKIEAIKYAKACQNGFVKIREDLMDEYFGIKFNDIWTQESFEWDVKWHRIEYSQVYLEFIRDEVYPQAIPLQSPSDELIKKCEQMYEDGLMSNPEFYKQLERTMKVYDELYGKGRYEEKGFPVPSRLESNKAPDWDLASFQQGVIA